MTVQLDVEALVGRLRELRADATQGIWQVQDGCSWRRIGTAGRDGDVLHPDTYSREDRHPDLSAGRGEDLYANLNLIVETVNALPALLAHIAGEDARVAAAVAGAVSEVLEPISEVKRAYIAGYEQAQYNTSLTPDEFFQAWWDFGQFYEEHEGEVYHHPAAIRETPSA